MHPQKIALIPLSLLGMLATFLPWAITPGIPASDGTAGAGWITFGIYALILVIIFTGHFRNRISGFSFTCINVLAILNSVYGFMIIDDLDSNPGTKAGFGLYILIVTGLLFPVAGILFRRNTKQKLPE